MAKTQYLEFTVNLSDAALVKDLTAQWPNGKIVAPYDPGPPAGGMAVEAANDAGLTPPLPLINVGSPALPNSLTSPWFDNSNTFPRNVATFTRSSGWWIFGSDTKFYWVAKFAYVPAAGTIPPVDEDTAGTPDIPDAIEQPVLPQRFYLDGIELPNALEGNTFAGNNMLNHSPAGAVFAEGLGLAVRQTGTSTQYRGYQPSTSLTPALPALTKVWSRFRLRVRRYGTGQTGVFGIDNGAQTSTGFRVYLSAGGQLALFSSVAGVESLLATSPAALVIDASHRLDLFNYQGANAAGSASYGEIYVCLDGELLLHGTMAPGGLVGNSVVAQVYIGHWPNTAGLAELDIDDWRDSYFPTDKDFMVPAYVPYAGTPTTYNIGDYVSWRAPNPMPASKSDIFRTQWHKPVLGFEIFRCISGFTTGPAVDFPPRVGIAMDKVHWVRVIDSPDFLVGSRLVLARPVSVVSMTNWTPAVVQQLAQPQVNDDNTINLVASSTALAEIQVKTNALTRIGGMPGVQGWAGFVVGLKSFKGTNNGKLGYKIGAAARVIATVTEGATNTLLGSRVWYTPTGLTAPEAIQDLELHYQKGNDAVGGKVAVLQAVVEAVGLFGEEDRPKIWDPDAAAWVVDDTLTVPPRATGVHNTPWHTTPWHQSALPALGPVMIVSGTYVGNGTGQDLTFKVPPAFLWIRPVALTVPGAKWWSALAPMGGIYRDQRSLGYVVVPHAMKDDSFVPASSTADQQMQFLVRLGTADATVNQNAVTYQYIAFCDPAARFCLSGVTSHVNDASRIPVTDTLQRTGFLPEFGFFHRGQVGTNSSIELWAKGTGHAADKVSNLPATAEVASGITFALGSLTFGANFLAAISTVDVLSYLLFRREDGNGNANNVKLMAMGDYVGDGSASRTISSGKTTGLRPVWAIVIPHNASQAHYRDASHTGTTSQQGSGAAQASTGISGGMPDGFTVGSSLNANGVTYSWFMLLGSATACNNGWGCNGEYSPVPSDSPVDPTFPPAPSLVVNDTATTAQNTAVDIDVLANDQDAGTGMTITAVTTPAHGTVTSHSDGTITYTPDEDFVGSDSFTYTATDGVATGTATVTVTVTADDGSGAPPDDGGDPDLDGDCAITTQWLANQALSRIGVSKRIKNVNTDQTVEADTVRLHIKQDVEATLRAFPWPFATSYANLTLVAGSEASPVNKDWTYSYRAPSDLVAARRLVSQLGLKRSADPDPPQFRLGGDTTGRLIYADLAASADTPLQLEYTRRIPCTPGAADPLFRDALIWRIAESLAPSLSRDARKADYCRQKFKEVISEAETVAANESQPTRDPGDAPWIRDRS